jgi:YaaC-like protein
MTMAFASIRYRGKALRPRKAIASPDFNAETVLVSDPWEYVDLWLKRKKKEKARWYWLQAREFSRAAKMLPPTSAPVPAYYCFLNATKALLEERGIKVADNHGVHGKQNPSTTSLEGERVHYHSGGVLGALANLLEEPSGGAEYSLKAALYNLPFIHRAYALTYTSANELFLPIRNPRFVRKEKSKEAWFCAEVETRYANGHLSKKLPESWEVESGSAHAGTIRMKSRFQWDSGYPSSKPNCERLLKYHAKVRKHVHYIYGPQRLWYLKRCKTGDAWIDRSSLTLTFAAMHRLSELSRYDPLSLRGHLGRQHNWLITEFIEVAPAQFIDEIASELTGCDFLAPGIRK